jgi:hypothetical protein
MTRRIPLVTALAFAGPVAFLLSACAAVTGNPNQDTGYSTAGNMYNRVCHDEVLRRYGDLRSNDISTRRNGGNSGYDAQVDWRTTSGGAGSCMVSSNGTITGFREDRSPYANGNYGSNNNGGWVGDNSNNNGNVNYGASGNLPQAQAEACRNAVMNEYHLAAGDVDVNVRSTNNDQVSEIAWGTSRGDSGTCIVNQKMEIAAFRKNNK